MGDKEVARRTNRIFCLAAVFHGVLITRSEAYARANLALRRRIDCMRQCRGRVVATCELTDQVPVLEPLPSASSVASLIKIDELLDRHVSAVTHCLITSMSLHHPPASRRSTHSALRNTPTQGSRVTCTCDCCLSDRSDRCMRRRSLVDARISSSFQDRLPNQLEVASSLTESSPNANKAAESRRAERQKCASATRLRPSSLKPQKTATFDAQPTRTIIPIIIDTDPSIPATPFHPKFSISHRPSA